MSIDINSLIAGLLYEQDTVIIPGLGALIADYQAAEIDQVQGQIVPPTKKVSFNKNLTLDDGLLIAFAQDKYQLSASEAKRAIQNYVQDIQDGLEKREIIEISEVGRLYLNYENEINFLPSGTNFNQESFGLPNLQVYPIIRKSVKSNTSKTQKKDYKSPKQSSFANHIAGIFQRFLPHLIIVTLIVISIGIYLTHFGSKISSPAAEALMPPTASRINVKPGSNKNMATEDDDYTENLEDENLEMDTEAPTQAPEQKIVSIAIGSFGNKKNVQKLIEKISEVGFIPVTSYNGKLTKVSIELPYEEEEEIQNNLRIIREMISKDAQILKADN
ncbi:MAG: SPOR domain-containing protein [Saprospiraceae bacterium]|nr:SPOR domain-containing protein [Saprospiraceae bacterium]